MKSKTVIDTIRGKVRSPVAVILGSPSEVAALLQELAPTEATCYQMDLYQADKLRGELAEKKLQFPVQVTADVWDLGANFRSAIFLAQEGGERDLKIDMVEQSFHVLQPQGTLVVNSPYEADGLFPGLLKKVFHDVHVAPAGEGTVVWASRDRERTRRRHEVTFQARVGEGESLRFLSRPGVFTYGKFDAGARALIETMYIEPGDRILDIGCGCGTNGIVAGKRAGAKGHVVFVDSNVRAVVLAEHNARANELESCQTIASASIEGVPEKSVDVILANPPYYAQNSIARMFTECSRCLLREGGRFYLVTKQIEQVGEIVAECFGDVEIVERRGYGVLCARR